MNKFLKKSFIFSFIISINIHADNIGDALKAVPFILARELGSPIIKRYQKNFEEKNLELLKKSAGYTLYQAIENKDLAALRKAISEGKIDVNIEMPYGVTGLICTPLALAAKNGFLEGVIFLIQKGADINRRLKMDENAKSFLEGSVTGITSTSLTSKKQIGFTALHIAVENENLSIVKFLVDNNANVNIKSNTYKDIDVEAGNFQPLQIALSKLYKIVVPSAVARSEVRVASPEVLNTMFQIIKQLVDHGAQVNFKYKNGMKPLDYAIESKQENIINYLKNKGATA